MKIDRWNAPFKGLSYFLFTPKLWGWALLGTLLSALLTFVACFYVIQATYPTPFSFWPMIRSLGWALFSLVLMVAIVFPLIFNACFAKGLSSGGKAHIMESFRSSFFVFFRTMKWRILWPVILLITILFIPLMIFPISLLAANHLAVIESVDLALTISGVKGKKRVEWICDHGTDCFAIALSGSLLTFLLSLVLIGWLFWIPAKL